MRGNSKCSRTHPRLRWGGGCTDGDVRKECGEKHAVAFGGERGGKSSLFTFAYGGRNCVFREGKGICRGTSAHSGAGPSGKKLCVLNTLPVDAGEKREWEERGGYPVTGQLKEKGKCHRLRGEKVQKGLFESGQFTHFY